MTPESITNFVYVVIVVTFLGTIAWVVFYSRKQSALLKQAEHDGVRPHSMAESIIISHEMAKRGKR